MTSVVTAESDAHWFGLRFEPCKGSINTGRQQFAIYGGQMVDVGLILQQPACHVSLVSTKPGTRADNILCMTYGNPNDFNTRLLTQQVNLKVGKPFASKPFRGIFCTGG
ncbi:hypothetical protein PTNB85_02392 [Pyrenophora teres f. teres]|nr:hypothetical protein PTNB85_02392 [Pyrenophora teres f. teres]